MAHEVKRGVTRVNKHTMNIDLRGRIDGSGKRNGKVGDRQSSFCFSYPLLLIFLRPCRNAVQVVDYKLSETRVLEVP